MEMKLMENNKNWNVIENVVLMKTSISETLVSQLAEYLEYRRHNQNSGPHHGLKLWQTSNSTPQTLKSRFLKPQP